MKYLELREKRMNLVKQAQEILTAAEGKVSAEDRARFDGLMDEADTIGADVKRMERADESNKELATIERAAIKPNPEDREDAPEAGEKRDKAVSAAFASYLRNGMSGLSPEHRAIAQKRFVTGTTEQRALAEGTGSAGGFLVPSDFFRMLTEAQKQWGGMRQARSTVLQSSNGEPLPFPMVNDTANIGAILGENTQVTELDMAFSSITLGAYMYTSKLITVPLNLVQDSAFDLEAYLARALGVRIGRATNAHFTNGTGSSQPTGVVTAATVGQTGATGQTLTVKYVDLVELEHSVDPAYRMKAEWMLHDSSLKVIKELVDGQLRPLWKAGLSGMDGKFPDTINGYPYVINQDFPVMAANALSIGFGDFSNFYIRDVLGTQVLRLNERYADFLQVAFLAFSRHDSNLIDAGTHPVKLYKNSAT